MSRKSLRLRGYLRTVSSLPKEIRVGMPRCCMVRDRFSGSFDASSRAAAGSDFLRMTNGEDYILAREPDFTLDLYSSQPRAFPPRRAKPLRVGDSRCLRSHFVAA